MLKSMKLLMVLILCMGCFSGCKKSEPETAKDVTAGDVQQEVTEAAETTGDYLNEEKDAIMKKTDEAYSELKKDTEQLLSDIKDTGKASWQALTDNLNSKLDATKAKYNDLKEAGADNLHATSEAFDVAAEELKDAYQKAKAEFQKENTP